MLNNTTFYVLLSIFAGIAVPIMATINASYGQTIQNVYFAAFTLLCVGAITCFFLILFKNTPLPTLETLSKAHWWHFTAGMFFICYIVSITYVAPKFGVGNAITFVVVAQIFTASAIDHFGLFDAKVHNLDFKRTLGIIFLVIGVFLAQK